jgi:hypothetical protein
LRSEDSSGGIRHGHSSKGDRCPLSDRPERRATAAGDPVDPPAQRVYFSAVDGSTQRSDADRELSELRAMAYGPDPDLGADPAALARLRELEAAHGADVERRPGFPTSEPATGTDAAPTVALGNTASVADQKAPESPRSTGPARLTPPEQGRRRSLWRGATATWWSRFAWVAGALVVVAAVVATVLLVSAPRPDATLHSTAAEADEQVRTLVVQGAPWLEIDASSLRAYGSYLGLEIWSATNAFDSPCLVAVHRASDSLSDGRCAPSPAELIMDVSSSGDGFEGFDGVAGDGIIRFIRRGDTVDVYVHIMPGTD